MSNLNFTNLKNKVTNLSGRVDAIETSNTGFVTNLANHTNSVAGAHPAATITLSPLSGIAATDVQNALSELLLLIQNHIDSISAHHANNIITDDLNVTQGNDVQFLLQELENMSINHYNTIQSRIDNLAAHHIAAAPPVGRSFSSVQAGIDVLNADIVDLKDDVGDHETLINQMLDTLLNSSNNNSALQTQINNLITGIIGFSSFRLPTSQGPSQAGSAWVDVANDKLWIYTDGWKFVNLV